MKKLRRFAFVAAAAIALGGVSVALAHPAKPSATPSADQNPICSDWDKIKKMFSAHIKINNEVGLLFIQQADAASITKSKEGDGCYTIHLTDYRKKVLYFYDQPKRRAGEISTKNFIQVIKHNGSEYGIKPNVAIQGYAVGPKGVKEFNTVVEVTDPKLDPKTKTISYRICAIKPAKLKVMAQIRSVNMFFDQFQPWP